MAESTPRVFAGPDPWPELLIAVTEGGCTLATSIDDADAVVWFGRDPQALSGVLPENLRWLQVPDAGIEKWVRPEFTDHELTLTCASGIYGAQVAEHALALILGLLHGLPEFCELSTWSPHAGTVRTLRGRSVLILGGGGIGSALARMVSALGATSTVVTRSGRSVEGADVSIGMDSIDDQLAHADVVVICLPATPSTRNMVDHRFLSLMKSDSLLINVARGDLVNSDDLLKALDDGLIAAAGLDVTSPEPLPDGHQLFLHPRVLVTPHVANPPYLKRASFVALVQENCRRFSQGQALEGVVDVERGY